MGKSGGRPKGKTTGFENKETIGCSKKKPNENDNDNENDNENDNDNDNAGDSCADGLADIIEFYENNIGLVTPYIAEILDDYNKEMPADLVIFAIKEAIEADGKNIKYIKAILNTWSKKNIKTVLEAEQEKEEFKKSKEKKSNKKSTSDYNQRDYDNLDFLYANVGGVNGNK